jgi:hypothetical protein
MINPALFKGRANLKGLSQTRDFVGLRRPLALAQRGFRFALIWLLLVGLAACAGDYGGFDGPDGKPRAEHELFVRYLAYLNDGAHKHIMAAYRRSLPDKPQGGKADLAALRRSITPKLRQETAQRVLAQWQEIRHALAERCDHCHDLATIAPNLTKEQEMPFWYAVHGARTRLNLYIAWLGLQKNPLVLRMRQGLRLPASEGRR